MMDGICVACGEETETLIHCIRDCAFATDVWLSAGFKDWEKFRNRGDILDWLMAVWRSCSEAEFQLCVVVAWSIWNNRNSKVFGGRARSAEVISKLAIDYLTEFMAISQRKEVLSQPKKSYTWKPPAAGMFKLNFDGALFCDGTAGIGVVARNHNGEVMASCAERVRDFWDVDHVEALGARRALIFAAELGLSRIHIEGDSLTVIVAIRSDGEDLSVIGPIINDCRWRMTCFPGLMCSHVGRMANQAAHGMARLASRVEDLLVWMEDVPQEVQATILADVAGFPSMGTC